MLDAVRALAHLTADGRWIHHTSKSEVMCSMQRQPAGQAGRPAVAQLPAAQATLPTHMNGLPAGAGLSAAACLPNRQADDKFLVARPPNIKKRCKPLKTIFNYPG